MLGTRRATHADHCLEKSSLVELHRCWPTKRPELLVLEGFINDAEEQNEYLRIILVIHRKFAPKKNGLICGYQPENLKTENMEKTGLAKRIFRGHVTRKHFLTLFWGTIRYVY